MAESLRAGVGESVITPPLGASLQGALHDRKAVDVHDDLYAKALVLDDGAHPIALINLDVIAIMDKDVAALRARVAELTHIPAENVMVGCTHTHTGPAMMTMAGIVHDQAYIDWLVGKAADSVKLAVNRLQPARVGTGIGREESLSFCRRFRMADGTVRFNPGRGNPDTLEPTGPIDPDVGVLYVEALDGTPIGAAVNFCLHYVGTDDGLAISADYFGHFAAVMRKIKGAHFTSLLFNGAQGQINNVDVNDPDQPGGHRQAQRVAEVLAGEVTRVIGKMKLSTELPLGSSTKRLTFKRKEITEQDLEIARRIINGDALDAEAAKGPFSWVVGQPIPESLRQVYAEECIAVAELPKEIQTELQVIRVGDAALVSLPGEVFVEIGLNIKATSSAPKTFAIGLANGFIGYTPTDVALQEEGAYETWTSRWSLPDVGAEAILVDAAQELTADLFASKRSQQTA